MEFSIKAGIKDEKTNEAKELRTKEDFQEYFERSLRGTAIIGIAYDKGVMVGCNTRTTQGSFVVNRASDKIWPLSQNIFVVKAGSAADTQFLINHVAEYKIEAGEHPPVKLAARIIQRYQYENRGILRASVIVCGVDQYQDPQIYLVDYGGNVTEQYIVISGSGSNFAYGYCEVNYKVGMSKYEAKEFVKNVITLGTHRDNNAGGSIRIVDITNKGYTRDYISFSELSCPKEI